MKSMKLFLYFISQLTARYEIQRFRNFFVEQRRYFYLTILQKDT